MYNNVKECPVYNGTNLCQCCNECIQEISVLGYENMEMDELQRIENNIGA